MKTSRKSIIAELERAAERIETEKNNYCCVAIKDYEVRKIFRDLFEKDARSLAGHNSMVWVEVLDRCCSETASHRNLRILLLLWCAEMVRTGEIKMRMK